MAMIKRLSLQGVRSFSPDDNKGQWIEFGSPLTLILGINGSGKTTIIEGLKYVITSQYPPNSAKGASFVNDPKLTFTDCSLAKITLDLVDNSGNRYTCTKKVKTVIKNVKGDLSTTQIEGTLRRIDTAGKVHQLTTKCNDIKVEMCRLMGVSEAILNYVIFCHQEESCWPLDEGKKVKETFDAIFNTLAYKKCFDRMVAIDKELTTKIKVEAEGLKYVIDNREMAIRYRLDLENKKTTLQNHTDAIKEYEQDIKIMEKKLSEFRVLEMEYSKKFTEFNENKTRLSSLEKAIEELRSHIKEEFQGGITDLKEHIDQFSRECSEKKKEIVKNERCQAQNEAEWARLDATKSKLLKEEGMFQQEENANKRRVDEQQNLMQEAIEIMKKLKQEDIPDDILSTSFSNCLGACNSESGNLSYEAINKALVSAIRIKDTELQNVKMTFDNEEKQLQKAINDVRGKMVSLEKEKDMKHQQLNTTRRTFEELKNRLKALEGSNERLKLLDDEEENLVQKIDEIEKSGFMMKCDSEIKTLAEEVKELDSKASTVSATLQLLNADKSKTDQISLLNRQKIQKQSDANNIMRKMEDELKQVLGVIPEEGLGAAVNSKLKSLDEDVKKEKKELNKSQQQLAGCKSEMKYVTAELKKMESKLKDCKVKVEDILEDQDYDTAYQDVNTNLEKKQSDSYFAESASYLYKKYAAKLKKKDCCPLCKRDFEARELARKLAEEIEGEVARMQQNQPTLQDEIGKLKEQQKKVLNVKFEWDNVQKLSKESIPKLKGRIAELEENSEKLSEKIDGYTASVSIVEAEMEIANKCRTNVALYEQCQKELKKIDDQIAKIEKSRDPKAQACTTTLTDAEMELEEIKRSIRNKRSDKENKEDLRNKRRDELAKLQHSKNKVKESKLKITAELQNREALEEQKKQQETSIKDLNQKIKELTEELPQIKTEITKAEKNKTACNQRRESALQKLREEKTELDKIKSSIADKNRLISEFERRKGKFAEVQERLSECKERLATLEKLKKEIEVKINALKKDVVSQELKERELKDNLSLKQKLEQMSKLKVELKEKEKLMSQTVNPGTSAEKRELQDRYVLTEGKRNRESGQLVEVRRTIKELERELASPNLANVEIEYVGRVAKKVSYEKAQRDIRRYKTALDTAIMQFHKKRMQKINKILMEYWRRIYRGNDIDRIMIKTEADTDMDGNTTKPKKVKATFGTTRKSYAYRVVMVRRGGVEIDMRGRCSAGQRVLASIIIRIALAESFGSRCGIVTLDEPTTNLDQKNIDSLASALADLAEKMSFRKNFQLIVITHDQDFTERLTGIDAVEKFWKVDRDKDGFSRITMVPKRSTEDGFL